MGLLRILKILPLILPAEHSGHPAISVGYYQLHMAQAITPTIFGAKVRSRATTERPACAVIRITRNCDHCDKDEPLAHLGIADAQGSVVRTFRRDGPESAAVPTAHRRRFPFQSFAASEGRLTPYDEDAYLEIMYTPRAIV